MSIRILPDNEIKQAASSFNAPPLLFANPKHLYQRRAERLRRLAEDHPFEEYLLFAANIAEAQNSLLINQPIANVQAELSACIERSKGLAPLNLRHWTRSKEWRALLIALIDMLKPEANDTMLATFEWLEKAAESELEALADALLDERYEEVSSDKAVFIWAALSLYWTQLTQQLPRNTQPEVGERQCCPVCGSMPVAGMVHFGETQGLRYLHCALCESQWNVVRAKCSCCEQSGKLDYWSLDNGEVAAVRAESCGDCNSYIKVMYQDKDPYVEVVADDLATIFLDSEMEEKGFARSALNPFLFSTE